MVYIVFLVPNTLMNAFPAAFSPGGMFLVNKIVSHGVTAGELLTALTVMCCIAAFFGTLILAFYTNLPFAQGPSLAIATFISFSICTKMGYSYNEAIAAVFLSGIVFFILTVCGIEEKIQDGIPTNLKFAVTAGIGLFIAFMGMQKAHLIVGHSNQLVQLTSLTDGSYDAKSALLCLFGVVFIAILLMKHVHGAIFIGKLACIAIAMPLGLFHLTKINMNISHAFEVLFTVLRPDFAGLFSPHNAWGIPGVILSVVVIIATLCIMDVFESMGTVFATDHIVEISHEGTTAQNFSKVLRADAVTTCVGSMLGVTTVSTYVESAAMAIEGGRTGLSGVVASICFLLTIFIAPVAASIPSAATATTLIMSGILMMDVLKYINFEKIEEALPAFLAMAMMPLTYSLVTGISLGLISHTLIMLFSGKAKQVSPYTYGITLVFLLQFIMAG
ncbi:MAG: NCS2 family permease [Firmicutes bacterium]|nr:NCS2 family permease [Bacillota bacterium]